MDKEIKKVLKSWGTSLERYGKLDGWNFSQNLSILGDYLRSKKDSNSIRSLVRQIRDKALSQAFDVELMMSLIKKAFAYDEPEAEQQEELQASGQREQKNGQDVRFRYETERSQSFRHPDLPFQDKPPFLLHSTPPVPTRIRVVCARLCHHSLHRQERENVYFR